MHVQRFYPPPPPTPFGGTKPAVHSMHVWHMHLYDEWKKEGL